MRSPLISLKKQREFKQTFKCGKSAAMPLFVMYAAKNDCGFCRLGVSARKKVGNAVVRNRLRRIVRECCRLMFAENEPAGAFDIILIIRDTAGALPRGNAFAEATRTLEKLFSRLGVFA